MKKWSLNLDKPIEGVTVSKLAGIFLSLYIYRVKNIIMDGKIATYFLVQSQKYRLTTKINIKAYSSIIIHFVCTICKEEYLFSMLS